MNIIAANVNEAKKGAQVKLRVGNKIDRLNIDRCFIKFLLKFSLFIHTHIKYGRHLLLSLAYL